jgi:hypothetical protein
MSSIRFVLAEGRAGVDAVAGGENVAAAGHAVFEGVAVGLDDLLVGAGVEKGAVDVAAEGDLVAAAFFDFGDVDAALGIEANG